MIKVDKRVFTSILLQTTSAILTGLVVLHLASAGMVPAAVKVGRFSIGSMTRETAAEKLEEEYRSVIENGFLDIRYMDTVEQKVKLADLDTVFDKAATLNKIRSGSFGERLMALITDFFVQKERVIQPVLAVNGAKLRSKLSEFAVLINKEPVNANISLRHDTIIKLPEAAGLRLNVDRAAGHLERHLGTFIEKPFVLRNEVDAELETVAPLYTLKDFEGVEEVISKFTTDISDRSDLESIRKAVAAINKVIVYPGGTKKDEVPGVFSFNKYLTMSNAAMEKNNEGYNQVASTLFAAAILAGIKYDAITRTPHKTPVEYIDAGLDAVVFGNTVDFKFKNTLQQPLVIFAEIRDNKIIVCLGGKKQDRAVSRSLKIEVEQKFEPSVIHVESYDLRPGEKRILSPGKEGKKVKVFMVTMRDQKEVEKKLLYQEEYRAVEAMVQIGPNTKWDGKIIK